MSIRRFLVLTLVAVLTLITFIAAIQGYKASMTRAEKLFEQQLVDFAQIVKGLHQTFDTKQRQFVTIKQQTSFAFQVWQGDTLVIQSANSPVKPIMSLNKSPTHFGEVNFAGQRWRTIYLASSPDHSSDYFTSNGPDNALEANDNELVIIVAQPLKKQFLLAQEVILAAVTPMIIAIVLLSFLIYGIITQGLKPLHKLTTALANKRSNDFTPLALHVDNSELSRVVITLNDLLGRLNLAFERERHFAADAAHELKTPLSVLKINVHNLSQELNEQGQQYPINLIKPLKVSVERMGHVIDQILHLNRTNPDQINQSQQQVKLKTLLQAVIGDLYQNIANKQQTITLSSDELTFKGDEISLQLMLTNLISNANKYTPQQGEIKVSTKYIQNDNHQRKSQNKIAIIIEDSGEGIPADEYHRVFDRFYRVGGDQHDSSVLGCGLGLTIVKHIVDMHRGKITLSQSKLLGGLRVEVLFDHVLEQKLEKNLEQSLAQKESQANAVVRCAGQLDNKDERS
ncbi:sensor histidine kinase [Colwellia psychrerythraea]|uniref:histidine kinase n=1 Tax=Colwellia psychrerythraea (strain 34H / ATCC BAA-681) TaxID=167879 RepID=Q480M2_COLP3|nr:ATP-binding protein [Colwellia psychrerythraea]AAZ24646.1 sensor histidine kinase [Colwellia psychrerythraea 34H]